MQNQIYVLGHKNPDLDSLCSAWAYANLKNIIDQDNLYSSGRCGRMNSQAKAVFERWDIDPPSFVKNLYPNASDVQLEDIQHLDRNDSILSAIKLLNLKNISMLPVFNNMEEKKEFLGTVSIRDVSDYFMEENCTSRPEYPFVFENLEHVLPGCFLQKGQESQITAPIMTGAMDYDLSVERINQLRPKKPLLVVGQRQDIISYAVREEFPAIVISGLTSLEQVTVNFGDYKGTIFLSFTDTAETIRLIRLSVPVESIMNKQIPRINDETRYTEALNILIHSEYRGLPVFKDDVFTGIVTRRCFINKPVRKMIMIDHNEIPQAIDGAEEAEIVEIIDHHRLAAQKTKKPIYISVKPVGSSCTIVFQHYLIYNQPIDKKTAIVLMSGILSDTVILKSPTTTPEDIIAMERLSEIAQVDYKDYGKWVFSQTPSLTNYAPDKIIGSDFKIYEDYNIRVGIGQVEVMTFNDVAQVKQSLLNTMLQKKSEYRLDWCLLLITNVLKQDSLLLSLDYQDGESRLLYKLKEANLYELPSILSRKKQLLPEILRVLEEINNNR